MRDHTMLALAARRSAMEMILLLGKAGSRHTIHATHRVPKPKDPTTNQQVITLEDNRQTTMEAHLDLRYKHQVDGTKRKQDPIGSMCDDMNSPTRADSLKQDPIGRNRGDQSSVLPLADAHLITEPSNIVAVSSTHVDQEEITQLRQQVAELRGEVRDRKQSNTDEVRIRGSLCCSSKRVCLVFLGLFVLVSLLSIVGGTWFFHWRTSKPELLCSNFAVGTVSISDIVTTTIPTCFGLLTQLRSLNVTEKQLVGSIPTELGLLTRLTTLDLNSNQLTGTIPTELGQLTDLIEIWAHSNPFSGTLPSQLGLLTKLTNIWIDRTPLTGTIPTEMAALTSMIWLDLSDNKLSGPIPTEMEGLAELVGLFVENNQLTGQIPMWVRSVNSTGLSGNKFSPTASGCSEYSVGETSISDIVTTTIPTCVGLLTQLRSLNVTKKQLVGSIPTELGLLTGLTRLVLSSNQLTGTIPTELGQLTDLTQIWAYDNLFSGTLPSQLGLLTKLTNIWLDSTPLAGTIPTEMAALTSMVWLDLSDNKLSGPIPTEMESLTELAGLFVENNQLTGEIPMWVRSVNSTGLSGNNFVNETLVR